MDDRNFENLIAKHKEGTFSFVFANGDKQNVVHQYYDVGAEESNNNEESGDSASDEKDEEVATELECLKILEGSAA